MARSDRFTLTPKKTEVYADFLMNFDMNPYTGFLGRVTNEDSVKQSLKSLVLTSQGERFYDADKGSRVRDSLFDLISQNDFEAVKIQLGELIRDYEPRCVPIDIRIRIPRVDISPSSIDQSFNENSINITIIFSIINIPDQTFSFDLAIERVR